MKFVYLLVMMIFLSYSKNMLTQIPSDDVSIQKIYLELTQRCNLHCVNCFRQNWTSPDTQMTQEIFDHFLSSLKQIDTLKEIILGGIGEPTIHPNFVEWVNQLPKVDLCVTTNAYYWKNETIELLANRFDRIVISVDGLESTFLKLRSFDFTVLEENVKKLINLRNQLGKYKPFLIAQLVLSTDNVNEIEELIPKLAKMGFMKIIISNLLPQNEHDKGKILYTLFENKRMEEYRNIWLNKAMSHQIQIKFPAIQLKTERRCNFVHDGTLTINSDGNISPCYRFAHPSVEYVFGRRKQVYPFHYGNIVDQSVTDIWNSRLYTDLRLQNLRNRFPSCPDCDRVDCCDYINDSLCDCRGQNPSCADCLWTRDFVQCI